jgi:hypothetical protein
MHRSELLAGLAQQVDPARLHLNRVMTESRRDFRMVNRPGPDYLSGPTG